MHKLACGICPVTAAFVFIVFDKHPYTWLGFLGGSVVKNPPAKKETWVRSLGREAPWRRKWQPTAVFLPEKSHVLAGHSPWGHRRVGPDLATEQKPDILDTSILALYVCDLPNTNIWPTLVGHLPHVRH